MKQINIYVSSSVHESTRKKRRRSETEGPEGKNINIQIILNVEHFSFLTNPHELMKRNGAFITLRLLSLGVFRETKNVLFGFFKFDSQKFKFFKIWLNFWLKKIKI